MANKILLPQEIETFYILPTIRRYLAVFLKEKGLKQKDIAIIFMVNTAAISQYSTKRGRRIKLPEFIIEEIKRSAGQIKDSISYLKETQRLLRLIRTTKVLCLVHKQISSTPLGCNPQKTGCSE